MILITEKSESATVLRETMNRFYEETKIYDAFQSPSNMPEQWRYVRKAIEDLIQSKVERIRVLEIGAGRTGFLAAVSDLRNRITFTAQDVTHANENYLIENADCVHIGAVTELRDLYDIIFSTFVFEHISDPLETLEFLFERLPSGGKLLIFCPRYDMPFYLSHSADHYHWARRIALGMNLLWRRFCTLVTGRPAFIIHSDPAIFHLEWSIDRDAIHWASLIDLRAFVSNRGSVETLSISSGSLKDWIVKNLLQINVCLTRT